MGRKLYVGNLSFDVNQKDLEQLFAQAGVCESVAVITDRATGQSRGFDQDRRREINYHGLRLARERYLEDRK